MFRQICEDCPARMLVDVDAAGVSTSWGTDGLSCTLDDANKTHTFVLGDGELNTSGAAKAVFTEAETKIETCDGPSTTTFKVRCGAGLAAVSRWRKEKELKPNVRDARQVEALLRKAGRGALLPASNESYLYVGDLDTIGSTGIESGFDDIGVYRTLLNVVGEQRQIRRGAAFVLDRARDFRLPKELKEYWRIRFAQGPNYLFMPATSSWEGIRVAADGIFGFLSASKEQFEQSEETGRLIDEAVAAQRADIDEYLSSGAFARDANRARRRGSHDSEA